MFRYLFILSALFGATTLSAQNLFTGGDFESGKAGDWILYLQSGEDVDGALTIEKGGANGSEYCAKATVTAITDQNWHAQIQQNLWEAEDGASYIVKFMAKGDGVNIHVGIGYGEDDGYGYINGTTITLTDDWKEYTYDFTSDRTGEGKIRVNFYVGENKGEYYFDDFSLEKSDASQTHFYKNADKRIREIRRNEMTINVVDADGNGVPNAKVKVNMTAPEFKWGTCMAFENNADSEGEKWYRETILKYFQTGVFENDFKWEEFERTANNPNYDNLQKYIDFSKENNFDIRGHALTWGIEKYGYDNHWARSQDSAYFAKALKTRIERDMKKYKGIIKEYDVWNEPFHELGVFNKFGHSLFDSAHVWARKADPDAKLFMNEYQVVSGGATETYYDLIKSKLDAKVPVDGIGVQCHFYDKVDPDDALKRLDRLAEFGLPIKVTEFDINVGAVNMSEEKQAEYFGKFMRAAFSHPAVEEFLFWGFWDARHWVKNGGIFNADKTPKMAADTVYNLIHKTWATNKELEADENGIASLRAFYGTYKITVEIDGKEYIYEDIKLKKGNKLSVTLKEGEEDATEESTDIEDLVFSKDGHSVKVAPNPLVKEKGLALIEVAEDGEYVISISNASGKKVSSQVVELKEGENAVPIKVAEKSIYILTVEKDNKLVLKFVGTRV